MMMITTTTMLMMSLQHYLGHQLELPLLGLGLDLANIGSLRFQELEHLMVIW